jgi:hypothetical protein
MATVREKYALYLLHLVVEIMSNQAHELVQYGVSPIGCGHMRPLSKNLQENVLAIFAEIGDLTQDTTVKMIEESAAPGEEQAVEWIKTMLAEIRTLTSLVGDTYGVERDKIRDLINDAEKILLD